MPHGEPQDAYSMRTDPDTLLAVQGSGGLGEALWGVPLLLVPIGSITGVVGAMAGRLAYAVVHGASTPNAPLGDSGTDSAT